MLKIKITTPRMGSFIKRQTRGTSSDNEWQRMITSDNEWQRMTTSDTRSDNEWYNEWQQVTTSDNEWQWVTKNQNEWQQMTLSDTGWQKVVQQIKAVHYTSKNGWLPFFQ